MTAILRRITERIEAIPSEVWEAGQAERNPLWQALDDIDDIIAEHDIGDLVRRAVGIDDGSDPIRLHDCGRFHRPSEPCPEAGS